MNMINLVFLFRKILENYANRVCRNNALYFHPWYYQIKGCRVDVFGKVYCQRAWTMDKNPIPHSPRQCKDSAKVIIALEARG